MTKTQEQKIIGKQFYGREIFSDDELSGGNLTEGEMHFTPDDVSRHEFFVRGGGKRDLLVLFEKRSDIKFSEKTSFFSTKLFDQSFTCNRLPCV